MPRKKIGISVVVPVYNEERSLSKLYTEIKKILGRKYSYEIVFVDDGSTDSSFEILRNLHKKDKKVRVIQFRKNFGQTSAISAGFDLASGETIVTMDGDLQNDPQDIPKLLDKISDGYEVVSGWRHNRKDDFLTRTAPSLVANKIISIVSGVHLHDFGCTLKAYKRDVVKNIRLYGEMHRFIPVVAAMTGARIAEVKVRHRKRRYGKSKYGMSRIVGVVLDLVSVKFFSSYNTRPIQFFGKVGSVLTLTGTAIFVWMVAERLFFTMPLSSRPLFLVSIFLILVGIQLVTIGLLAEVLTRIYYETQDKKTYYIKDSLL